MIFDMSFLVGWGECFEKLEVYFGVLSLRVFIPSPSGFCLSQSTPSGMGVDCILFQERFLWVMIAPNMIRKTARTYKRHRYALSISKPYYWNTLDKSKLPLVQIVGWVQRFTICKSKFMYSLLYRGLFYIVCE